MFSIPVKIERAERKKRSAGILHILAGLFLFVNSVQYAKILNYNSIWVISPNLLLAVFFVIYGFKRQKMDPAARYNATFRGLEAGGFLLTGLLFLQLPDYPRAAVLFLWAIISLLLLYTERQLFAGAFLRFTPNEVSLPGTLQNKSFTWQQVTEVAVRPDFITFYFPGNRYLQFEVLHKLEPSTLQGLQDFCRVHQGNKPV